MTEAAAVRAELEDHLLEKVDELKHDGLERAEAILQAIEDHGNPVVVGYRLRKWSLIDVRTRGTARGVIAIGPRGGRHFRLWRDSDRAVFSWRMLHRSIFAWRICPWSVWIWPSCCGCGGSRYVRHWPHCRRRNGGSGGDCRRRNGYRLLGPLGLDRDKLLFRRNRSPNGYNFSIRLFNTADNSLIQKRR